MSSSPQHPRNQAQGDRPMNGHQKGTPVHPMTTIAATAGVSTQAETKNTTVMTTTIGAAVVDETRATTSHKAKSIERGGDVQHARSTWMSKPLMKTSSHAEHYASRMLYARRECRVV